MQEDFAMMTQPYLFFDGRCEEALKFYEKVLGAKVEAMVRFKDVPEDSRPLQRDGEILEKVAHCNVRIGDDQIMASDGECSGKGSQFDGFALMLTVKEDAEAKRLFDALLEGGQVLMPFAPTFYASSFGSVKDKFGVGWMVIRPLE